MDHKGTGGSEQSSDWLSLLCFTEKMDSTVHSSVRYFHGDQKAECPNTNSLLHNVTV
jgi:hypothetical protein